MGQEEPAGEVTRLLQSWREGDPEAFEPLIPVVYDQLHRIALGLMRHERSDHTLQATALLNELYVRLLNQRKLPSAPLVASAFQSTWRRRSSTASAVALAWA